jgi:hypothetical protein
MPLPLTQDWTEEAGGPPWNAEYPVVSAWQLRGMYGIGVIFRGMTLDPDAIPGA